MRGLGSAVSSPSGVLGEAPADKRFGAYGVKEQSSGGGSFFVVFLRTNVRIHVSSDSS